MFGKSNGKGAGINLASDQAAPEAISCISFSDSIVGKIVGHGTVAIFGHVEGELHAASVQISDGAKVEGNITSEELTIGGHFKGTIHANRVKLNSTAVVEGDIFHRSLAMRRMRNSRECRDDRKTSSIFRRASYKTPAGTGRVD